MSYQIEHYAMLNHLAVDGVWATVTEQRRKYGSLTEQLQSPAKRRERISILKKPERIEALLMVMTCCLMVYAGLEHQIRTTLVEKNCYFPSMKYKPEQRSTARWVFQCFEGITIIYWPDNIPIVANLETRNQIIIDCLGQKYQQIYS
jgi:hypothetical protein